MMYKPFPLDPDFLLLFSARYIEWIFTRYHAVSPFSVKSKQDLAGEAGEDPYTECLARTTLVMFCGFCGQHTGQPQMLVCGIVLKYHVFYGRDMY